jgi:hypothetical protein
MIITVYRTYDITTAPERVCCIFTGDMTNTTIIPLLRGVKKDILNLRVGTHPALLQI